MEPGATGREGKGQLPKEERMVLGLRDFGKCEESNRRSSMMSVDDPKSFEIKSTAKQY